MSDNISVWQGLVQRQLCLGKPLFICFVDFSKAFDLVNRHILFFKLIKSRFHGRVIDTLRSLHKKTDFRVKIGGKLSSSIKDELGVKQGGNASPTLSRKYLADLKACRHLRLWQYHRPLLWTDNLAGLQTQLDGLLQFCSKELLIVNEMKTKTAMVFGNGIKSEFYFNGVQVERVDKYKNLGAILNSTEGSKMDIFASNADYFGHQARRTIFRIHRKTKYVSPLPLNIACHLYRSLVQPIVLNGSDVWGKSTSANACNQSPSKSICHRSSSWRRFVTYAIFEWQSFQGNTLYPLAIIHMEHINVLDFEDKSERNLCFSLET